MFVTHPAMAAAATLVVVVGVAGAVYMRQGKLDTADPAAERVAMEKVPAAPAAATPPAGAPTPTTTANAAAGSSAGFGSGPAAADEANDQTTAKVDLASAPAAEPAKSAAFRREQQEQDQDRGTTRAAKPVAHLATAPAHADTKGGYLALGKKNEPAPKDLDGEVAYESATGQAAAGPGGGGTGGDATARLAPATTVAAPVAAAAAPPPPPPAPAPSPTYAKGGKQKVDVADKPAPTPSEAELNKQLKAAINAVNADDCPTSAKIMGDIKQRAPAFYDKHADDREFKHCNAYGDGQVARRKAAPKAQAAPADEAPTAAAPVNAVPAPTPTQSQAPAKK
jgi:2-oxoglutarate dehydrogenase E2 component (dihydrolipoamide succinyltransferase)